MKKVDKQAKLLVVGNGFDLTADAKTSYNDYYNSDFYHKTRKVAESIMHYLYYGYGLYGYNDGSLSEEFTCWDLLFFYRVEYEKSTANNWYDIELMIKDSLIENLNCDSLWDRVFNNISNPNYTPSYRMTEDGNNLSKILSDYIRIRQDYGLFNNRKKAFYYFLLSELKHFETRFGQYVKDQTSTDEYKKKADKLAKALLITENETGIMIDTFNYSKLENGGWWIRYINGDYTNPIFGINLMSDINSHDGFHSIFTKSSRRLYADVCHEGGVAESRNGIRHAVVFGHSLNTMDYDYFSYLFSLLGFSRESIEDMGVIEFVYIIYDQAKAEEIRRDFTNRIYRLFSYYEKSIGITSNNTLMNRLLFSKKLKTRELSYEEI